MQTENFSRQDGLQLIESMINRAKNQFNENGTLYLLWGYTIVVCCLVQFVVKYFYHSDKGSYVWMLTWVIVIYQVYFLMKKRKQEKVTTYTDSIIGFVWLSFVIALFLLIFILSANKVPMLINPVLLVLYGIPTFLSGAIIRFRPLMIGGACCFLLSAVSVFVPAAFHFLLLCGAVIAAWIIPGHLLSIRFKKEKNGQR